MRVLERVWRKRKRRDGDRDNVCGGGDSIGKKKTKMYGCNEKIEKRNNIKFTNYYIFNKKCYVHNIFYNTFTTKFM